MFSIISWLVAGFVIGLIARALVPGKQALGTVLTIGIGVAGSFVGGIVSSFIWPNSINDPTVSAMWPGWIFSILGAVILLAFSSMMANNRNSPVS